MIDCSVYIFFSYCVSEPNVIEGDILGETTTGRTRRAATSKAYKLWSGGVIPYVIADDFTSTYVDIV